ncbi:MAG: hypothetical protein ACI8S3_000413 [Alphaproteobacteria bacterium]|jgi:hypothetical protein
MLSNLNDILGYGIQATDKPAGTVNDVFIDDVLWTVRHVAIADAGGLGTQMASVGPSSLGKLDRETRHLHVNKSHDQIAEGPDVSSDLPVANQGKQHGDPHLRSIREVKGYKVVGVDGPVGKIDDFIAGDDDWKIHFVVIAADATAAFRKVLVGPGLINRVDFDAKTVHLELDSNHFAKSPEYNPAHPIEKLGDVELVGR